MITSIFGVGSNPEKRFVPDYQQLAEICRNLRGLDQKIVMTSGSFDIIHIGHGRYLERAREQGDFLVVGVDSDEKIRKRKGPDRPAIPEEERLEMLMHMRHVDLVTLKTLDAPKWSLIEAVRPDVLIATAETYSPEQVAEIEERFGCSVVVLDRQAEASTSGHLRNISIGLAHKLTSALNSQLPNFIDAVVQDVIDGDSPAKDEGSGA